MKEYLVWTIFGCIFRVDGRDMYEARLEAIKKLKGGDKIRGMQESKEKELCNEYYHKI